MQLFYAPDIDPASDTYFFPEEESAHLVRVLRLRTGDRVGITDGRGAMVTAMIEEASPKACRVTILGNQSDFGRRAYGLHVAIAPTKNMDRLEWFVEKAVEIGIDRITPILCDHSERKMIKTERLEKIAVSAMKQSLRAYLPQVDGLVPFGRFIGETFSGRRYIAHCDDSVSGGRTIFREAVARGENSQILIGPEGDFSPSEIEAALAAGFQPVTFGSARLRTETAALYAAAGISFINE